MFMSKVVNLTGLLGDIKEDWGSRGRKSPSRVKGWWGSGRSWSFFCETTHNISIKIQQKSCCCYWI